MNVKGFKAVPYRNSKRVAAIPFRVLAERNASDFVQLYAVDTCVKLADEANHIIEHFEQLAALAVAQDGQAQDLNDQPGKVAIVEIGKVSPKESKEHTTCRDYKACIEFEALQERTSQPVRQANIRWHGLHASSPDDFIMKSEASGDMTLQMTYPVKGKSMTINVGPNGTLTIDTQ